MLWKYLLLSFFYILFSDDFIAAFVHQRSVLCWISLFCATRCVDVCAFCIIYDGNIDKYVHCDTCRRRKIYRTIELFYLFCWLGDFFQSYLIEFISTCLRRRAVRCRLMSSLIPLVSSGVAFHLLLLFQCATLVNCSITETNHSTCTLKRTETSAWVYPRNNSA